MAAILILLAITSSALALPNVVYTTKIHGSGQYTPGTNKVLLNRNMTQEFTHYTYIHELAHWYYFEKVSRLGRGVWARTFVRERYIPTEYCADSGRHIIEECFAEAIAQAYVYDIYPEDKNSRTYKIVKIVKIHLTKCLT